MSFTVLIVIIFGVVALVGVFFLNRARIVLNLATKTLVEAREEIDILNIENRKYLAEIVRLRAAMTSSMVAHGMSPDAADDIVFHQRTR